jgi:hypothetical protein
MRRIDSVKAVLKTTKIATHLNKASLGQDAFNLV